MSLRGSYDVRPQGHYERVFPFLLVLIYISYYIDLCLGGQKILDGNVSIVCRAAWNSGVAFITFVFANDDHHTLQNDTVDSSWWWRKVWTVGLLLSLVSSLMLKPTNWTDVTWVWPPLWSSGHSFWLLNQWSRVRFPALPDFLSSSGSGTGFTQPLWG
jgi:hypothetical protein